MTTEEMLAIATPLAVIVAAIVQQLNTKRASEARVEIKTKLEDVKVRVKAVHSLANSAMTAQLKITATALRALANETGHPAHIAQADAAETLFHEHEAKQRELNAAEPKRVLLVDDDDNLCELITQRLKGDFPVEIISAHTISVARQRLEAGERFDGVILDARVVDGGGVSLYRELTVKWPNTPVVFLTGFDDERFRAEVEAVGPAAVFQKASAMRIDFLEKLLAQIGIRRGVDPTPQIPLGPGA